MEEEVKFEVDFVTIGDAAEKLDVPAATLRSWTEQLEDLNVHYVKRNQRKERIYYASDLKVFQFFKSLKAEHGRKTTTKDLAAMIIYETEKNGTYELRTREDAPVPESTFDVNELLNQDNMKELMGSSRVQQFMHVITEKLRDEVIEEMREERNQMILEMKEEFNEQYKALDNLKEHLDEKIEARDQQVLEQMNKAIEESKRGFWSKLFGK